MKKNLFILLMLAVVGVVMSCDKENKGIIVDSGGYAFKQSEQCVELSLDTESARIELYYTEQPKDSEYRWVTFKYDAEKSTPEIEKYVTLPPTHAKWEVAEDGTLYYDIKINNAEIKQDIYLYLYVMSGNETYTEYNREMVLHITAPEYYAESYMIAKIVEECKDFSLASVTENIVGKWELDSFMVYDEGWSYMTLPYIVNSVIYVDGLEGSELFTFAADGTGTNYENYENSETDPLTTRFDWVYDEESSRLACSGEYNLEWKVTGFSNDYIVLDRIDQYDGDNLRTILKRIAY